MRAALLLAQVVIAFVLVAVTMPVVLAYFPAARETALGPGLAVGLLVVVFVILRLVWPRHRA